MAEEGVIQEVIEEVKEQASPQESQARQGGWKPLEEWEGHPDDWVDARTFNQRGEYLERIKSQSSLLKKLEKKLATQEQTLKELAEHHRNVATIEREKALKELKTLKKEALDLADHDKVVEIDDKIADLKQQKEAVRVEEQPTQELDPVVLEWIEDNPWYESDPVLAGAANGLIADIIKKQPDLKGKVKDVLGQVTAQLKEEFPQKFGRKPKTMQVTEPGSSAEPATKAQPKYTVKHLSEDQKKAADRFIKAGALKNVQEYVNQMADQGLLDIQAGAR